MKNTAEPPDQKTKLSIWEQLSFILKPEKSFYLTSIIYGLGVAILTLAIPISVQAVVNTVSFGVLVQPIIYLSIVLLALLIFSGALTTFQNYIIELFHRHFYARTSSDMSVFLLNTRYKSWERYNGVELVNRYFDIMTIQSSATTLFTEGVAVILQAMVGLVLLAFYHPYYLVFDLVLLVLVYLVWVFFGKRALAAAVQESKAKYATASWLEDIARSNLLFKSRQRKEFAARMADENILGYLSKRKTHFRLLISQSILFLLIYAIMSAFILGLGGFLVINNELTLGQLVASELVVTLVLAGVANAGKYLGSFYDLYAAVDKVHYLYKLNPEEENPFSKDEIPGNTLHLKNVRLSTDRTNFHFDFEFEGGKTFFIRSRHYAAELVLLELVQKLIEPHGGSIEIGEFSGPASKARRSRSKEEPEKARVSYEEISPFDIRDQIYVMDAPKLFEGTIRENLTLGDNTLSAVLINEILDLVDLSHTVDSQEEGLDTKLLPSGYPLWSSQLTRLEIARAILSRPKILILKEIFDSVECDRKERILNYIKEQNITLVYFSNDEKECFSFDNYLILENETVRECKSLKGLKEQFV